MPSDEETRLIQDALLAKLFSLKQFLQEKDERFEEGTDETKGFYQLIRMIFARKYKNFKNTMVCKHSQLRKSKNLLF